MQHPVGCGEAIALYHSVVRFSKISIIVCTLNRASGLSDTIQALGQARLPENLECELVLVDNGSKDHTAELIRGIKLPGIQVRYILEPARGKSSALNTALRNATGELLLFTDDDVLVGNDWIEQYARVFSSEDCDGAVGKITLAPHLERDWLTPRLRWALAAPESQPATNAELIGANMALRRSALSRVPQFDPELGPGALGRGEESLFSLQLLQAGCKIHYAEGACVVHNLEPFRLQYASWVDLAAKIGRQQAYIRYHWRHETFHLPKFRALWYQLKLRARRRLRGNLASDSEGCAEWESSYITQMEMYRRAEFDRSRPRNYAPLGATRLVGA